MTPILILAMVLWTTFRHEASHALVARWMGAEIHEMRLLPGVHPELGFYFGYVEHSGVDSPWIEAAPFLADLVVATGAVVLLRTCRWTAGVGSRYRFPIALFGLVSPLIDLAYNYQGGLWRPGTDVHDLFQSLPDAPVHLAFWVSLLLVGLALRASRESSGS